MFKKPPREFSSFCPPFISCIGFIHWALNTPLRGSSPLKRPFFREAATAIVRMRRLVVRSYWSLSQHALVFLSSLILLYRARCSWGGARCARSAGQPVSLGCEKSQLWVVSQYVCCSCHCEEPNEDKMERMCWHGRNNMIPPVTRINHICLSSI